MESIDASSADVRAKRFPVGAQVTIEQLADDMHTTLARLRSVEPVSWLPAVGGWLVSSYATALDVLRDPIRFTVDDDRFTTGQVVGPSMLSTDGVDHRRHRSPFEPLFRRASATDADSAIQAAADSLVAGFKADGEAELRTSYAAPLAVSVIAAFLGLHDDDVDARATAMVNAQLLESYRTIVDTVVALGSGDAEPGDAAEAVDTLGALVDRAVRGNGTMAELAGADGMTPDRLRSNVAVILFGAIETCEGMTANAIHHVLTDPAGANELREADGVGKLIRLVNESLRLEPAAAVVDRYATTDIELESPIGTVAINAGDLVEVSLAGANRDPTVFADPDRFDPGRPRVGQHLAFARGPHVCLGLHLAKLQTAIALETLFRELPTLRRDARRSTDPRGHIFRKPESLVVQW